jgi:hypothetical protein
MIEDLRKLSKKTDEQVHKIFRELELEAAQMGLGTNPTLWFGYMTNTALMALSVAIECEVRQVGYGALMNKQYTDEERAALNQAFKDNAHLISEFYFREIIQKRCPKSVQVKVEADIDADPKKEKEAP